MYNNRMDATVKHQKLIALRPASAVYLTTHHINWSMVKCITIWAKIHACLLKES